MQFKLITSHSLNCYIILCSKILNNLCLCKANVIVTIYYICISLKLKFYNLYKKTLHNTV